MRPILEERNQKIRRAYRRYVSGKKMSRWDALDKLADDFSEWQLSYLTLLQIVSDRKYGER